MLLNLEHYLRKTFAQPIEVIQLGTSTPLPDGMRDSYQCFWCYILDIKLLLMKPFGKVDVRDAKRDFQLVEESTDFYPVLWLEKSTGPKRALLAKNLLSFVVADTDIFLCIPDLYIRFTQGKKTPPRVPRNRFSVSTQQVFLFLLYSDMQYFSARGIADELGIGASSVSRALHDFSSFEMIYSKGQGNTKRIIRCNRQEFWDKGLEHLASPIKEYRYFKQMPEKGKYYPYVAGESYSDSSRRPEIVAISSKAAAKIRPEEVYDDDYVTDGGYVIAQVWKYSPGQFGQEGYADIASVYLTLPEGKREPLEEALQQMLKESTK